MVTDEEGGGGNLTWERCGRIQETNCVRRILDYFGVTDFFKKAHTEFREETSTAAFPLLVRNMIKVKKILNFEIVPVQWHCSPFLSRRFK